MLIVKAHILNPRSLCAGLSGKKASSSASSSAAVHAVMPAQGFGGLGFEP